MPTTLTGLLLFVVLLLPGFAYLVGKERHGVERRVSAFRETVSVVAASVTFELLVLVVSSSVWAWTVDVNGVLEHPGDHRSAIAGWGLGLLLTASLIAYLWSWPRPRRWAMEKLPSWIAEAVGIGYPHPSTVSSWWRLFDERKREIAKEYGSDPDIQVGCYLDDGSYVTGGLWSWSPLADDVPDRELVLAEPQHRPPDATKLVQMDAQFVSLSARHITKLIASHYVSARPPSDEAELPAEPSETPSG